MSFALSKIRPPRPRAGLLLPRPALEAALREALGNERVVLLCAAAGYGKTATLARALEQRPAGHALAWISLDEGDDLTRLLECLMAALEPFDVPWRTAPEGLIGAATRPAPDALPKMVAELINTLDACELPHGVIVFDDLHHVTDEACLRFVDLLLQQLTPRWTVAITARHEPSLRLARLRASGELIEFREQQLRFDDGETQALLTGAGLDAATARLMHTRTGGWAAGLRLALNGARGGAAGETGAIDRQAFDFLAAEVLTRIDPGLREFLLLTSVLHELDPTRCAAVMGDGTEALRWLEEIERLGLFANVVDEAQPTLRLHDLFRDALRHRLRLERPDDWPRQLKRAAAIETDPVRCQGLLLAAGAHDEAARALLAAAADITTVQGVVNVLLQLCAQFPPAFAEQCPEIHRVRGIAHWVVWETRPAEFHLSRAEELFAARGDRTQAVLARANRAIILIALGRLNDAAAVIEGLGDEPDHLETRVVMRLARTWHALESCRFDAVAPAFELLVQLLESRLELRLWYSSVPPPRQTPCRGIAPALARWADGALAVCGERPVPLRAMALLARGWLLAWQGQLDEAAVMLQRSEDDAQWTGQQVITRHHALALRALLAVFRGDHGTAMEAIKLRLAEHPKGYGDWGLWHTLFMACRVAAACGDAAILREWWQRIVALQGGLTDQTPQRLQPLRGLEGTLAWLEGRADDAIALWRAALDHEESLDLLGQAAEVRVRLAAALAPGRQRQQAAALLAPLLEAANAAPGGALFVRTGLRELAAMPWGGALSATAQATLQRWATSATSALAPPAPAAAADEGLTARELDVLAYMAQGASNKVIARTLDLSPHTVKRHVANILGKLDLAGRAQASAWWQAHRARSNA